MESSGDGMELDASDASDAEAEIRKLYHIIDARPKLNALANQAAGNGFKYAAHYGAQCTVSFLEIGNIHTMRGSIEALPIACQSIPENNHLGDTTCGAAGVARRGIDAFAGGFIKRFPPVSQHAAEPGGTGRVPSEPLPTKAAWTLWTLAERRAQHPTVQLTQYAVLCRCHSHSRTFAAVRLGKGPPTTKVSILGQPATQLYTDNVNRGWEPASKVELKTESN
eukprot:gene19908-26502_t